MQQNNKVVLLLSGGIDSTVLLYYLLDKKFDIYPLYINYGQITSTGEIRAIRNIINGMQINKILVIDISDIKRIGGGSLIGEYPDNLSSHSEWYKYEFFPNRNLLLLTLASNYAYKINAENIAIGVVGNSYNDTSFKFLDEFENLLKLSLGDYKIIAPFTNLERKVVVEKAVELNVPLELTFSCNALAERHCLLCTSCLDRENAFKIKINLVNGKSIK